MTDVELNVLGQFITIKSSRREAVASRRKVEDPTAGEGRFV